MDQKKETGEFGRTSAGKSVQAFDRLVSSRLELVLLKSDCIEAMIAGKRRLAERIAGFSIPDNYALSHSLLTMRLAQLHATPSQEHPWLLRAIVLRETQMMCGHINFHSRPGSDELKALAADGVELGYSVMENARRRGYAKEAALALMKWAFEHFRQQCFVLSIGPDNVASLAMARSLGFAEVGSHLDEEDGLELYFLRRIGCWPAEWAV